MTKKFLFVTMAIAFAFGMMVSGCADDPVDQEGFKNHTLNLTDSGANSITLTVKGATWKDPKGGSDIENTAIKAGLLKLLEWTQGSGSIESLLLMDINYDLISENKLKIAFSKQTDPLLGLGITGSGTLKIQSSIEFIALLIAVTDGINITQLDWSIGKNDPVTITIN